MVRPRFHLHFTPTYGSWTNEVESWFGIITQKAIRGGCFHKVGELPRKVTAFVEDYNAQARPFMWVATAADEVMGGSGEAGWRPEAGGP